MSFNSHKKVKAIDLAVLLGNVHVASQDPAIGFEDADTALDAFKEMLNTDVVVPKALLERSLWSSNLLAVKESFWHPLGLSFEEFLESLGITDTFDKYYNVIEEQDVR